MHAVNVAYGGGFSLCSDQEILRDAGIDPPAGQATFYDVSRFVIHRLSGPLSWRMFRSPMDSRQFSRSQARAPLLAQIS